MVGVKDGTMNRSTHSLFTKMCHSCVEYLFEPDDEPRPGMIELELDAGDLLFVTKVEKAFREVPDAHTFVIQVSGGKRDLNFINWSLTNVREMSLTGVIIGKKHDYRRLLLLSLHECVMEEGHVLDFRHASAMRELHLVGMDLDDDDLRAIGLPPIVEILDLSSNLLVDFSDIEWPDTLEYLCVSENKIENLGSIVLPRDTLELCANENQICTMSGFCVNAHLYKVLLKKNKIKRFDMDGLGGHQSFGIGVRDGPELDAPRTQLAWFSIMIIDVSDNPLEEFDIRYSEVMSCQMSLCVITERCGLTGADARRAKLYRGAGLFPWYEVKAIARKWEAMCTLRQAVFSGVPVGCLPLELCRVLMEKYM